MGVSLENSPETALPSGEAAETLPFSALLQSPLLLLASPWRAVLADKIMTPKSGQCFYGLISASLKKPMPSTPESAVLLLMPHF